jgi:CO/xanthine dehydrogenase FAD-binding subunit
MKAAPFDYVRPASVAEACAMLGADDGARLIAGGQTLVPMMAMRLAQPTRLIDIARIPELAFIRDEGNAVVIGATTRHCVVERDMLVRARLPLLAAVMPWVGHAATRVRGTVGGSLANADPAAELPLVAITLDASLIYRNGADCAEIPASEFFIGAMTTALPAAGCITAMRCPVWQDRNIGIGFHEVSARRGDYAFVSAAAQLALDDDGRCRRLAVGVGAVTACPIRLHEVERALIGTRLEDKLCREAVQAALAEIEPLSDLHASAAYRRRVAGALALRAIADAYAAAARDAHAR